VIIEFISAPGAGKTTSCDHLEELLTGGDIKVHTRPDLRVLSTRWYAEHRGPRRWNHFARFLARNQRLALEVARYGAALHPRDRDFPRRSVRFLRQCHDRQFLEACDGPWILDQGILQGILSLQRFGRARDKQALSRLLVTMAPYLPAVVLVLDVEPDQLLDRIESRRREVGPIGEIDAMSDLDATMLRTLTASVEDILEALAAVCPEIQVCRVSGLDSPPEIARAFHAVVMERLRDSVRPGAAG
jgi:hypothetical protein